MLQHIAQGVLVHQSEFIQSNTVAVQGRNGVLLIDAGITHEEMAELEEELRRLGQPVVAGFSTHAHWDHLLWDAEFCQAPRYGTARSAADIQAFLSNPDWKEQIIDQLPPDIEVPLDLLGQITGLPPAATHVPWDGPAVRIIEHRAHAAGHAALVIEERKVLVAGDMLSDVLVPMLDAGATDPIADYLTALDRLEAAASEIENFVPGHGSIGGGAELRDRIDRDRAYVHALRDGGAFDDPRIGPSAKEGWEWVNEVHNGQLGYRTQGGGPRQGR